MSLLNFFISPAIAETAAAPQGAASNMSLFIMLGIFVVFMYFVIWRPQSKRAKEHRDLIGSLAKGDEVITAGGMLGRISKVSDQYIVLAIANEVEITIQKSSISTVLPKGTMKTI